MQRDVKRAPKEQVFQRCCKWTTYYRHGGSSLVRSDQDGIFRRDATRPSFQKMQFRCCVRVDRLTETTVEVICREMLKELRKNQFLTIFETNDRLETKRAAVL